MGSMRARGRAFRHRGAIAGYLSLWSVYHLFRLLTGKEGMGYGDFKLFAALGAWLGWKMLIPIILIAALVGAIVGIVMISVRGQSRATPIAFGPFLAAAGWLMLMFGPELVTGYLGMFAVAAPMSARVFRVGLTGGIASGKSTAAKFFGALGVPIIDTDQLPATSSSPVSRRWSAWSSASDARSSRRRPPRPPRPAGYRVFGPEGSSGSGSLTHPAIGAAMEARSARPAALIRFW